MLFVVAILLFATAASAGCSSLGSIFNIPVESATGWGEIFYSL